MPDLDNKLPHVSGGAEDIKAKLLDVAENYFEGESTFLRTGFMGYVTDSMSMLMRDSILHRNMKHNEAFLSSASTIESIYAWAKTYNVDIELARPSRMAIDVIIKKEYIDTYADSNGVFKLDRSVPFYAGEFPFSFEYSIKIKALNTTYSIEWDIEETPLTNFSDIYFRDKYIKWANYGENNEYIVFIIPVYQFKTKRVQRIVTGSSLIHNRIYTFEFTDQLCDFKIENERAKLNTYFSTNVNKARDEKFCYYNLVDDTTLQITFSSMPGEFLPKINTYIDAHLVTTKGSRGNIEFTGNLSYQFEDENRSNISIEAEKISLENALGGKDILSPLELKRRIMHFISSRDNIATEGDLNNYFRELEREKEESNSSIFFRKKRSDMIRRIFSSYVLLKKDQNNVYPTNTIDVRYNISDGINIDGHIDFKEGSHVKFVSNKDPKGIRYRFTDTSSNFTKYDYITPLYTTVKLGFGDDISHVKYIQRGVHDSTDMVYVTFDNESNIEYIPGNLDLICDPLESVDSEPSIILTYKFSVSTNQENSWSQERWCNKEIVIGDKNSSEKINITLRSLELQEGENTLEIKLPYSEIPFSDNGKFAVLDSSSFEIRFNKEIITDETTINTITFLNELSVAINTTSFTGTISRVRTLRNLTMFRTLDNIITSDLEIETEDCEEHDEVVKSIVIKDVPVVYQIDNHFNEILNENIEMLLNNIHILSSNFTYDMKFFNTYGLSDATTSTQTNIKLKLKIQAKRHKVIPTEIRNKIKEEIKSFVIAANVDKQLSVTLLISHIQASFIDYISHIEFLGLNGTFTQLIEERVGDDILLTPEYWNISDSDPDGINITFE